MRKAGWLVLALLAGGCGDGGASSTNYADPPPMAEIVATPSPRATATPADVAPDVPEASDNALVEGNGA